MVTKLDKTLRKLSQYRNELTQDYIDVEQAKKEILDLLKQELLSLEPLIDPQYHGVFVAKIKELEKL